MFFAPGCEPCNVGLSEIGDILKNVYDPQKMIVVAVSSDDAESTYKQLRLTPLPNARIIHNGNKIKETYWITSATNAFVVTNKDHVIQFTAGGSGGIINAAFKSKVSAILAQ